MRAAAVGLVALLLAAATGCGATPATGSGVPTTVAGSARPPGGPGSAAPLGLTRYPAGRRPAVPDLSGSTLDGGRLDLAGWRGSVVVVNFWATWCEVCRTELPVLARLSGSPVGQGMHVVGVDELDDPAAATAFAARLRARYPQVIDADAALLGRVGHLVPAQAVPSTLVVDAQGRLAARVVGPVTADELSSVLHDLRATG